VQYPLADYQTTQEMEDRKGRTMKDYCNFLKHNADARRAVHGGKGVAARRRTNGAVSYEARISKHNVGVSVPYAVRIPRICFVFTCFSILMLDITALCHSFARFQCMLTPHFHSLFHSDCRTVT
jgi:hypothetical protein